MTSVLSQPTLEPARLEGRLQILRRRIVTLGAVASAGWALLTACLVVLASMWLDLAFDLSSGARAACDTVAWLAAMGAAGRVIFLVMRSTRPAKIARQLDDAGKTSGQILSGVDLSINRSYYDRPVTMGLADLAVDQAAQLASRVSPADAIPAKSAKKPYLLMLAFVGLIGLVGLIAPRLIATQWLRFIDPYGDHPPYSNLTFTVEPGNASVLYGASLDIRASIAGGSVERVDLVFAGSDAKTDAVPMFFEGDNHYRATLANISTPGTYFIQAGRARSQHFNLGVSTVPKLQDVRFKVTLPAYAHRAPYVGPMPANGLSGLSGTTVEVHATSNRPLSGGTIRFSGATTQPATVALTPIAPNSNEVWGAFQIKMAGRIEVGVTDVAAQASTETLSASVSLLADERPVVRMMEPKPESFATPDADVKAVALAEDDFGISAVSIYRGLNDTRPRPTAIPVPQPAPTAFPASLDLPLSEYGLKPGDVIQLFARAEDNDPAGAKGSESSVVTLRIISQKDMDKLLAARDSMETLQSKYEEATRRLEAADQQLEKLEKELAAKDPNAPLTDEERKAMEKVARDLENAAREVEKFSNHDMPFDIDLKMNLQLQPVADDMRKGAQAAKEASKMPGVAGPLDKVREIRKNLTNRRQEFEKKTTEPLEHMAKIFPLLQDEARFLDLYAAQKDLASRLDSLKEQNAKDDPKLKARMRDLEDEQAGVRKELNQLLDDLDNHAAQLPDDARLDDLRKTAHDFALAVRGSPAPGQMQDVESALQDFTGTPAAARAHDAEETLSKFIGRCNSMGSDGRACLKFAPELSSGMGSTIEQMLGAMGMGGGAGGYNASRSSLHNVGLYGTIPMRGREAGGRGGEANRGVASRAGADPNGTPNPEQSDSRGKLQAVGQSDVPVPPEYKQRVGNYFKRVADELSD